VDTQFKFMEFQGDELTILWDVTRALVVNSKLLGFSFRASVKNHETRDVMECRALKRTPLRLQRREQVSFSFQRRVRARVVHQVSWVHDRL
jgi:hypothetical protein